MAPFDRPFLPAKLLADHFAYRPIRVQLPLP